MKQIRTRYAPSPTGFLHIGGARTALFNFLFAKHHHGAFIFRLEDTDLERNVPDGERSQIENLIWLGIVPDESPLEPNAKYGKYRQSEKLARYDEIASKLMSEQKAYKAYDTSEELGAQKREQEQAGIFSFRYDRNWLKISDAEKMRRDKNSEYTIRLALKPNHDYAWTDLVRGKISVNTNDIGDWVIIKQDKYPTYNFAVVVDDHDMAITHVLRGEEHITNTPKQLAVYDALNWAHPEFGHLTIITDSTGKKLSKRDQSIKQFIEDYKTAGYLPESIFNFLALLGWTHPQSKEILSKTELISDFDHHRLSNAPTKFDLDKMHWFAKEYFKKNDNEFVKKKLGHVNHPDEWVNTFIETYKPSVGTFSELKAYLKLYEDHNVDNKQEQPLVVKTFAHELVKNDFTIDGIKKALEATKQITKLNGKDFFMPIRHATTYQDHGAELSRVIYLTGEKLIKKRLGL